MTDVSPQPSSLLSPAEVAKQFRVGPKTVTRWADRGLLKTIRTPGGHRRFLVEDIQRHLNDHPRSLEDDPRYFESGA